MLKVEHMILVEGNIGDLIVFLPSLWFSSFFLSTSLFIPPPLSLSFLQLLSLSLDQVDNEEWLMELGNALGDKEQVITKYSHYPQEKVDLI